MSSLLVSPGKWAHKDRRGLDHGAHWRATSPEQGTASSLAWWCGPGAKLLDVLRAGHPSNILFYPSLWSASKCRCP